VAAAGALAGQGVFADAARFGECVFVCTKGEITLEVMRALPVEALRGKVVIDLSNPLDFSHGFPPSLSICNTNSLAEEIQRAHPEARVVKTLNIVNCSVMTAPQALGRPTMFVAGGDTTAKAMVFDLLRSFGWSDLVDLGGLERARGMEMMLPLWLTAAKALGTPRFAFTALR
jgi:predicted dinucleotide-binding enzyme